MKLDSGRPRHEQISDYLREQIDDGAYEVDEKLPSEHELGDTFDVSRVTVRRALQTLEHEGYIYRRQGLGSFVKEQRAAQGLVRLTDFAQDMARAGLDALSSVTHYAPETAPPDVAVRLNADEDATVMRLDRLRLGDGRAVAFDRTWLPVFYAHLLEGHDLEHETIYGILESEYDVPILRGRYRITAASADASLAEPLGVPEGDALLLIERLSFTQADKPVYFQRRYYRNDRVAYELELARDTDAAPSEGGMPLRDFEPVFDTRASDEDPEA
jgi:GntR family transcriptional regulator